MAGRILGRAFGVVAISLGAVCISGCSVKRYAVEKLADTLSAPSDATAREEDPDLIRDAAPYNLKLLENLLVEVPDHGGLLKALVQQFAQYAFAFVQLPADELEEADFRAARAGRERARRLYARARGYGLRGLEVSHPGFSRELAQNPGGAASRCGASEVPLLYWTAAAWGAEIALSKDRPSSVAELPQVEALASRALALDEAYSSGAPHTFFVAYEAARPGAPPGTVERVQKHFGRAVDLSGGRLASPYVAMAEGWAVRRQDKALFRDLLGKALAIDADAHPENRLENLVMQRRARWLLGREEALFVE